MLRTRVARLREIIGDEADYSCADAAVYGGIRAHLSRLRPNAQLMGVYDLMLAAQALRMGAVLVTHNTAEFSRVPHLSLEDWQEKPAIPPASKLEPCSRTEGNRVNRGCGNLELSVGDQSGVQ